MGKIERTAWEKEKRNRTQKLILSSVTLAGLLPLAVLAPNVIGAIEKLGVFDAVLYPSRIKRSLKGLIKGGLLEFKSKKEKKYLAITEKGRKQLNRWEIANYQIKKPKRWDGKWRVIIFDIQEKRRKSRDQLRMALNNIGFKRLQNSVWVFPYDCEDLLMLLKADMALGKNLLYLIVDEIENDRPLLQHFGLN
ncbi:MAG: CRISPR-associated endonuclease Cas2 [Patescibacteria group bacterium]